ncbi:hypothetical protein [Pseudalkalibacillus decolorationis]|uniref:hypothetical protein n=1 Tax=Pseudalkalibacillus decolorationis TaxID=163879 RepID=UPI0021475CF8|nr:hypothetical protein [Pseudalkalibacillus decolorationis]
MKSNRVDKIIMACGFLLLLMLVGMTFNIWPLVFFTIPLLTIVLLALGALNKENEWGPLVPWIIGFGIVFTALFIWAGIGMTSQETTFGGFSLGAGVIIYFIWPFITFVLGLLYAMMFKRWLKWDIKRD